MFAVPGSYTTLGEGDLYDATENLIQDGTDAEKLAAQAALDASSGWFIDLLDGTIKQKTFSPARIFDGVILFSTYQGERVVPDDVCTAGSSDGLSNIYAVGLLNASASLDLDESGVVTIADRTVALSIPGLPPTPVILFPPDGSSSSVSLSGREASVIVGLEEVFKFPDRYYPVNWEQIIQTTPTP